MQLLLFVLGIILESWLLAGLEMLRKPKHWLIITAFCVLFAFGFLTIDCRRVIHCDIFSSDAITIAMMLLYPFVIRFAFPYKRTVTQMAFASLALVYAYVIWRFLPTSIPDRSLLATISSLPVLSVFFISFWQKRNAKAWGCFVYALMGSMSIIILFLPAHTQQLLAQVTSFPLWLIFLFGMVVFLLINNFYNLFGICVGLLQIVGATSDDERTHGYSYLPYELQYKAGDFRLTIMGLLLISSVLYFNALYHFANEISLLCLLLVVPPVLLSFESKSQF